jgi:cation diffusion facilitator family transporter
MRWIREITPQPDQGRLYRQAMVITLAGNLLLAVAKGVTAAVSGSVALYADAANSASDVVYSFLMVFGLWVAQRPPDLSHPQGHSRFEPLVGMAVTASMAFAGFEAARAAVERLLAGGLAVDPGLPTLVLVISALIKAGMFLRIRWIARALSSPTLGTAAQDNLSDVLTSSAAFLGALGSRYIHPMLDAAGGILVALWIFRAVYRAARENLGFLTGAGADEELRLRMVREVEKIPGVLQVHHLMSEYTGPRVVVDLHVNVDGGITLAQAHDIADKVIACLEGMPEVDRAYVHVEPEGYE